MASARGFDKDSRGLAWAVGIPQPRIINMAKAAGLHPSRHMGAYRFVPSVPFAGPRFGANA
jgi:hypothetical protein